MNIFENFIPHEAITCNERNPPWMNKQIKTRIANKTSEAVAMRCSVKKVFLEIS